MWCSHHVPIVVKYAFNSTADWKDTMERRRLKKAHWADVINDHAHTKSSSPHPPSSHTHRLSGLFMSQPTARMPTGILVIFPTTNRSMWIYSETQREALKRLNASLRKDLMAWPSKSGND